VIIFQYTYGLPKGTQRRRGQYKKRGEWGLAWCRRIIDQANDWDFDGLMDLLTTGMLRMRPEERLSAGACLTKGCDLGLFDGHSVDSGSATPTRHTAPQGEISDDDGSTTILLGALWDTEEEGSNHDGNSRTGCHTPDRTSGVVEPRTFRAPNSPTPADLSCSLEARSIYPGGYKRKRSPAVGSANISSDRQCVKRRPSEVRLVEVPVSRTFGISDRRLGHDGESNQFCPIYDAVLALLTDLLGSKSQDIDIDDRTSTLIGELSEYLARLEITAMRLTRNDVSGQAIVAIGLDRREIMLASLTPSELMSSTADLAAHLLYMVQFRNQRA